MTGQFFRSGSKVYTNFSQTPKGASELINNFYTEGWQTFVKSAGAPGYNISGAEGMFNPIFGKDLTALMFSSVAVSSAIGKRAYQNEGMRLIPQQATVGTASDFVRNGSAIFNTATGGTSTTGGYDPNYFLGLGAGTTHDGCIMDSVQMPIDEVRVPYKELPFAYDYGLGLKMLENKDDTSSYNEYIAQLASNYNDLLDKTLLRPLANEQPKVSKMANYTLYNTHDEETGLNSITRVISSGEEMGKTYKDSLKKDVTITGDHVCPWGGVNGDLKMRSDGWDAATSTNNHTRNNYDAQIVDAQGGLLTIGLLDDLHMRCMTGWDSISPDGKFWVMSPMAWNKTSQLKAANNILEGSIYTSISVGGVKTVEGREGGFTLNSYRNLPIVQSGNVAFDYTTRTVDFNSMGDIFLLDTAHLWVSLLSPMQVTSLENIAITRDLREHHVMLMRAELRADKFIGSGRVTNIAKE